MYKNILLAIDLNDETSCRKPLLSAVELARTFGAGFMSSPSCATSRPFWRQGRRRSPTRSSSRISKSRIDDLIRRADASELKPNVLVTHGASIYAEILGIAEEAEADLIVVGSHRPAMKDYLLGTNAARVVHHARCSVLVARE